MARTANLCAASLEAKGARMLTAAIMLIILITLLALFVGAAFDEVDDPEIVPFDQEKS